MGRTPAPVAPQLSVFSHLLVFQKSVSFNVNIKSSTPLDWESLRSASGSSNVVWSLTF